MLLLALILTSIAIFTAGLCSGEEHKRDRDDALAAGITLAGFIVMLAIAGFIVRS